MAIRPDKVLTMLFQFNSKCDPDEDEHTGTDRKDVEDHLQVYDHTDYIFQSDNDDDDKDDDDHGSRSGDVYDIEKAFLHVVR